MTLVQTELTIPKPDKCPMVLYHGLGFGVLSLLFSMLSRSASSRVPGKAGLRSVRLSFLPDYGRRADFTERGWLWRNLIIACQILAFTSFVIWSIRT